MSGAPATFKQSDVVRALLAAKKAGIEVRRIKIGKDGTIEIDTGKPAENEKNCDEEIKL
jgi:hypothetical protein